MGNEIDGHLTKEIFLPIPLDAVAQGYTRCKTGRFEALLQVHSDQAAFKLGRLHQ